MWFGTEVSWGVGLEIKSVNNSKQEKNGLKNCSELFSLSEVEFMDFALLPPHNILHYENEKKVRYKSSDVQLKAIYGEKNWQTNNDQNKRSCRQKAEEEPQPQGWCYPDKSMRNRIIYSKGAQGSVPSLWLKEIKWKKCKLSFKPQRRLYLTNPDFFVTPRLWNAEQHSNPFHFWFSSFSPTCIPSHQKNNTFITYQFLLHLIHQAAVKEKKKNPNKLLWHSKGNLKFHNNFINFNWNGDSSPPMFCASLFFLGHHILFSVSCSYSCRLLQVLPGETNWHWGDAHFL